MKPHDTQDEFDDPIEALRAELQRVPPPAGYVARLRQRVDAEASAPAPVAWWQWALPLAAVAAVLVAITMHRPAPQEPVVTTARVESSPIVSVTPPSPIAPPVQPIATRSTRGPAVVRLVDPPLDFEPMPEIITNQAEVLRSLWARAAPKAALVESTNLAPDPAAEIVVAPIEIAPIVIKPLTDTGKPGSLPIVRPPNRDSSEGRAK
jgi:hypothetical protein